MESRPQLCRRPGRSEDRRDAGRPRTPRPLPRRGRPARRRCARRAREAAAPRSSVRCRQLPAPKRTAGQGPRPAVLRGRRPGAPRPARGGVVPAREAGSVPASFTTRRSPARSQRRQVAHEGVVEPPARGPPAGAASRRRARAARPAGTRAALTPSPPAARPRPWAPLGNLVRGFDQVRDAHGHLGRLPEPRTGRPPASPPRASRCPSPRGRRSGSARRSPGAPPPRCAAGGRARPSRRPVGAPARVGLDPASELMPDHESRCPRSTIEPTTAFGQAEGPDHVRLEHAGEVLALRLRELAQGRRPQGCSR